MTKRGKLKVMTVTIKVNEALFGKIREAYSPYLVENHGNYIVFQARKGDLVVTGYSSKKGPTVVFSGDEAKTAAQEFDPSAEFNPPKTLEDAHWLDYGEQIGSDEVGTGDLLCPIVVVAAYVSRSDIQKLIDLGVRDSKKLTDERIRFIGEALEGKCLISRLILPNDRCSELILKGENMNSIKAKLHNRALLNLHKQHPEVRSIYVDEFAKESTYYGYLDDPSEPKVRGITFRTKGESYYPSVALASVMARYGFLKYVDQLNEKYKVKIPYGSNLVVEEFAVRFIEKYGKEEFAKIAKRNFANYSTILMKANKKQRG